MALAFVVEQQDKVAEAETMYRDCLAMQRKFLGNEHPNLVTTLDLLAGLVEKQGKTAEAKALRDEAMAIRKKAPGNDEVAKAQAQAEKGMGLLQQGKGAEAEIQFRESLAAFRKFRGKDDPATLSILGPLAIALEQQQRFADAEALNREVLVLQLKLGNGEQVAGAQARFNLAQTLQQQGKSAEAETLLREALAVFTKTLGPEHKYVADTTKVLDQLQHNQAERELCFTNLLRIHAAIMAYRKDHQKMPDWLGDLVPAYLSDTNCFICPVQARTGQKPGLSGMEDPKITSSYIYEFNAHTNVFTDSYGVASPGDTMKTWKEKQLARYGPVVPVVRCFLHPQVLSVTWAGDRRAAVGRQWEVAAEQAMQQRQPTATNATPKPR